MKIPTLFFGHTDVKLNDLYRFFSVLERYNDFGVPVRESIERYLVSVRNPAMKQVLLQIQKDLNNGMPFPAALAKHPKVFPKFLTEMVRIGEDSSQMNQFLKDIVFYLEQEISIRQDVKSALWMPKIFFVGMIVATMVIVFLVIPKMGELLSDAQVELPLVTRCVMAVGNFSVEFWWLIAIVGMIIVAVYNYWKRNYPEQYDMMALKLPFFADIFYNQLQYRFAKVFGLCREAGIETSQSLRYAAIASNNFVMCSTLNRAAELMSRKGLNLEKALQEADSFGIIHPDFYIIMQVESAGNTTPIILEEATRYQKQMMRVSKTIGDKIGLAVTIPGYVILIILFASMEFPLLSMMQNINISGGV